MNFTQADMKADNTRPRRLAVLDLGTNTFHLLIADTNGGRPSLVYQQTIAVKLGEGGITEGRISSEALDRGIKALKEFSDHIKRHKVTRIHTAATSAIRSAINGPEFVEKVKQETGLELNVINGDQEAQLIWRGVREAVKIEDRSLIVDIGGGSVELIICDTERLLWKASYPIGAARLMSMFHHSDPISTADQQLLKAYLNNVFADFKAQLDIYQPTSLIGSAGAFETFADLQGLENKASFQNPEQIIDFERFNTIYTMIIASNHRDRVDMPEIPPVRVDMIVVASIITKFILDMSGIKNIRLSAYSLKEGILFDMLTYVSGLK